MSISVMPKIYVSSVDAEEAEEWPPWNMVSV
jgi:hypothetical protein